MSALFDLLYHEGDEEGRQYWACQVVAAARNAHDRLLREATHPTTGPAPA